MTEQFGPTTYRKVLKQLPPCLAFEIEDIYRPLELQGRCTASDVPSADACCGVVAEQLLDQGRKGELGNLQRNATELFTTTTVRAIALGVNISGYFNNLNLD